jgi:CheY-like chemotaxis protein
VRVLVVDDESEVILVLGDALRERGHQVQVASSGHDAVETSIHFRPDAAIVDIGLPDMDGVTLAELLRGAVPDKHLRVVAFSGYSGARIRDAVQRDVFDAYLMKPASLQAIEDALVPAAPRA